MGAQPSELLSTITGEKRSLKSSKYVVSRSQNQGDYDVIVRSDHVVLFSSMKPRCYQFYVSELLVLLFVTAIGYVGLTLITFQKQRFLLQSFHVSFYSAQRQRFLPKSFFFRIRSRYSLRFSPNSLQL